MKDLINAMSKVFSEPKEKQAVHDNGCLAQPLDDHHPSSESILPQERFSYQILKMYLSLPLQSDDVVEENNAGNEWADERIERHVRE